MRFYTSRPHFLLRSTRYAIASRHATAKIASKPGGVGEGEGEGVGVSVGVGVGVPGSGGVGVISAFSPKSTKVVK